MNSKEDCNILIIKFLYKLSIEYSFMKSGFKLNGLGNIANCVNLYGDITLDDKLATEIKSIEAIFRDKVKKFKFVHTTAPTGYSKTEGVPRELGYFFDEYRRELRSDKLDNLLDNIR